MPGLARPGARKSPRRRFSTRSPRAVRFPRTTRRRPARARRHRFRRRRDRPAANRRAKRPDPKVLTVVNDRRLRFRLQIDDHQIVDATIVVPDRARNDERGALAVGRERRRRRFDEQPVVVGFYDGPSGGSAGRKKQRECRRHDTSGNAARNQTPNGYASSPCSATSRPTCSAASSTFTGVMKLIS